jgi:hypothetical protein
MHIAFVHKQHAQICITNMQQEIKYHLCIKIKISLVQKHMHHQLKTTSKKYYGNYTSSKQTKCTLHKKLKKLK